MFARILVTLGLSNSTWSPIPYVRYLALKFKAELHLLGLSTEPQQVWDSSLMAYLNNIARNLQEENITTHTNFVYGNPAVEVVKYCSNNGIDLVATTAGSGNEISSTILTSIAKRMGIKSDVPVLMVPASRLRELNLEDEITFKKILVPLDCSEVGEAVIPYIVSIAQKTSSSVTLLHVNTPPIRGVPVMHNEVVGISRWAGKEYLKKIFSKLQNQGITADFEVVDGTPVKTIVKYACQNKPSLIAFGIQSVTGIENWVFGNLVNKVSERITIPLLTVSYPSTLRTLESQVQEYASKQEVKHEFPDLTSKVPKYKS